MKTRLPLFRILLTLLCLLGIACVLPNGARAAAAPGTSPTFSIQNLAGSTTSVMVVQGDFNGDGAMDIASANFGNGTVSIHSGATFTTVTGFTTSGGGFGQPAYLAVGDFNRDGKPDLVVANKADNSVTLMLNTTSPFSVSSPGTTPTFTQTRLAIGTGVNVQPLGVAIADVNGDGKLDFATANSGSNDIRVFFGDGAGGFATSTSYSVPSAPAQLGSNPNAIVFADLDRDGKPDMVTDVNAGGLIWVYLNRNTSSGSSNPFTAAPVSYTSGANVVALAAGDMNGDLSPDIVVSANGLASGSDVVSVFFGNGDGTLGTAPCPSGCGPGNRLDIPGVGSSPQGVAVGDVNGDSYPDIAIVDDAHDVSHGITVFLGNGLGCFGTGGCGISTPVVLVPGSSPKGIAIGDVTNDGKPDVCVANSQIPGSPDQHTGITLFANTLAGATACPPALPPASSPVCMTDRRPCVPIDIGISNVQLSGGAAVRGYSLRLRLSGNLALCQAPVCPTGGGVTGSFAEGNYLSSAAGPGLTEFHVAALSDTTYVVDCAILDPVTPPTTCGPTVTSGRLFSVYVTNSTGTSGGTGTVIVTGFTLRDCTNAPLTAFACPTNPAGTIKIDRNSPLAVTNLAPSQKKTGNTPGQTTAINVSWVTPADVNSPSTSTAVDVWRAQFLAPSSNPVAFATKADFTTAANPRSVAIGDMNGDGNLDLAVACISAGKVSVLLGTGTGTFGAKTDFAAGVTPSTLAMGDLNGDGKLDVVVTNNGGNTVSVLLGDGAGTLGSPNTFTTGSGPQGVAIGDLNGDGYPDLAVANSGSGTASVLLGTGTGTFGAKTDFATGSGPQWVAFGDLNCDGQADLVVANTTGASVSILLGCGNGVFKPKTDVATGSLPYSVAIGELNNDGKPDLAVTNSSGAVQVFPGTCTGAFGAPISLPTGAGTSAVAIGDLNCDGNLDVVSANSTAGNVSALRNNGAGGFAAAINFATGAQGTPGSVAIADVNNDGKLDVIVVAENNAPNPGVSVLIDTSACAYPDYQGAKPATPTVDFLYPKVPQGAFKTPWTRVKQIAGAATQATAYVDESFPVIGIHGTTPLKQRGFWFYAAARVDPCGNISPVTTGVPSPAPPALACAENGVLNYHLGDVTVGFNGELPICIGDNLVQGSECAMIAGLYNRPMPLGDARSCFDIGPTCGGSPNQRSTRENARIDFEDMSLVTGNRASALSGPQFAAGPAAADHDEISVEAPSQVQAGDVFKAQIRFKGMGDVLAISTKLGWNPGVAEPEAVEAGELARAQGGIVLAGEPAVADAFAVGPTGSGFTGDGVLATVSFRARASGDPGVTLVKVDGRDRANQHVFVNGGGLPAPSQTAFAAIAPNPFKSFSTLSFALAAEGRADLAIYSVDGRRVRTLSNGVRPAGTYRLTWDGTDDGGRVLSAGLFYARLTTAQGRFNRTLVMLR